MEVDTAPPRKRRNPRPKTKKERMETTMKKCRDKVPVPSFIIKAREDPEETKK